MKALKVIRYFLIELLYTGVMVYFFLALEQDYSISTPMEESLLMILILGLVILIWAIGPTLNRYVVFLYSGAYALYFIGQTIYQKAFHQYCRINTALSLYKEVLGVKESATELMTLKDFYPLLRLLAITVVFIVLYFTLQRRCFKLRYRIPIKLAVFALLIPMQNYHNQYLDLVEQTKEGEDAFLMTKSDYSIYEKIPNTNQFVDKFGVLPFVYRDVELYFTSDSLTQDQKEEVAQYLSNRPIPQENEMTGLFEGKNIIVIQAESYINAICSKELTPTLYELQQNSIRIENFNTPALPGSTSDTEFMANTSFMPCNNGHVTCYEYPTNYYPTTLASLFHDHGYVTYAFHNNYGNYYNRTTTMNSFHYDDFLYCTKLGLQDAQADSSVMEIMQWIFTDEEKPYCAYWITYSGHQPYDLNSIGVAPDDVEKIKSIYPDLDDAYVSYVAKNIDLDRSLSNLMKRLKAINKLDDVVFVFFGDHIVKGLDFTVNSDFYSQTDTTWSPEKTYTDLYIYNTATDSMVYPKVATALDLLPTIANLWGFEYDSSTILGTDIFDPNNQGFYFSEWEFWKTDHYSYDTMYEEFYDYGNYSLTKAQKEMAEALHKQEISTMILELDYFNSNKDSELSIDEGS